MRLNTRNEVIIHSVDAYLVVVWSSGSAFVSINQVNLYRARLVLEWETVSGFNSRRGTFISVCNQPPRSTQPGHPFVGRRNEYQPKSGDALRLVSKGRYGMVRVIVCGWQVRLCDALVTHGPYLSALEIKGFLYQTSMCISFSRVICLQSKGNVV